MKKDKLIELYDFLNRKKYIVSTDKIKQLTDENIDYILHCKYPTLAIDVLTSDIYESMSEDRKEVLLDMMDKAKSEKIAKCIIQILSNENLRKIRRDYSFAKIVNSSTDDLQAIYATEAATDENLLNNEHALRIIELISQSKSNVVSEIIEVVTNPSILKSGHAMELASTMNIDISKVHASFVTSVITNESVIESGKLVSLAKIVCKAKGNEQARYTSELLTEHPSLLSKDNIEELASIVSQSVGEGQAINASYVAIMLYYHPDVKEYLEIISKCEGDMQSYYGREFIVDDCAQEDKKLSLLKIICNSVGVNQAKYAYYVATEENVQNSKYLLELTEIISKAKGNNQAEHAYFYLTNIEEIDDRAVKYAKMISDFSYTKIGYLICYGSILYFLSRKNKEKYLDMLNIAITKKEMSNLYNYVAELIDEASKKHPQEAICITEDIEYNSNIENEYDFWKLYDSQPTEAMEFLKDNVSDDVDLSDGIVLRRKM